MSDETAWAGSTQVERRRSAARVPTLRSGNAMVVAIVLVVALIAGSVLVAYEAGAAERRDADRRLTAVTASAAEEFVEVVDDAEALVRRRAADLAVARALASGDRRTLTQIARVDGLVFIRRGRVVAGQVPAEDAPVRRTADVIGASGTVGSVLAAVRLDERLVQRLERAARITRDEAIVLLVDGTVVAGAEPEPLAAAPGTETVEQAGTEFRAATTQLVAEGSDVRLSTLTPIAVIDSAAVNRRNDVLAALLASLVALTWAVTALVLWQRQRRLAQRTRSIEVERRNIRDALSLVGDALASTHDTEALLPVILQTAVEAAGATGGRLLRDDVEIMRTGRPSASKTPLVLPLGEDDEGRELRLSLYAAGGAPLPEARELAEWFVSQAAIALENARLHGIVKRQAITDPLTGLANRRRFVEALETELSRVERFETELAVVIADLDDFKNVNDSFGHEVGNDVLRAFADVISDTLRDVDVAARLGGEEFAMLLPQTDLQGGLALAERIRSAFAATDVRTPDGRPVRVTSSFGVASNPPTATADGLLRAADGALYQAKAAGKDRVESG